MMKSLLSLCIGTIAVVVWMTFCKTLAGDWQAGAGHEQVGSGASNPAGEAWLRLVVVPCATALVLSRCADSGERTGTDDLADR